MDEPWPESRPAGWPVELGHYRVSPK